MKKLKSLILMCTIFALILSGCSLQGNPPEDTNTPDATVTEQQPSEPVETPQETVTPTPEISEPPVEEPSEPVEEPTEEPSEEPVVEPEEPEEPEDTILTGVDIYLQLYNTVVANSLAEENYILTYSEQIETNSLNTSDTFTSKYVDIYKIGPEYYMELMNKNKAYVCEVEQSYGDGIKSFTARNASNVYTKAVLKDFDLSNGLNDIYTQMTDLIDINEEYLDAYEKMNELCYITYYKTEDEATGNTTYYLSIPNINSLLFDNKNDGIVNYIDGSKLNNLVNTVTDIEFQLNTENQLVYATIIDYVDYDSFAEGMLKRHVEFSYEIPTVNTDMTLNAGELKVSVGDVDYSVGRLVNHKPYAAEQSGGTDSRKWTASYISNKDGNYREVAFTAEKNSGFTVNGLTKDSTRENVISKYTKILYQNKLVVMGIMESGESKFMVTFYFTTDDTIKSVDIKLLPEMGIYSKVVNGYNPWTMLEDTPDFINTEDNRNVSEIFEINKNSIMNSLYKGLNSNKEIHITMTMGGKVFKPYNSTELSKVITPSDNEYIISYMENGTTYETTTESAKMILTTMPKILNFAMLENGNFEASCNVEDLTFSDVLRIANTKDKYFEFADSNAGNVEIVDITFVRDDYNNPVKLEIVFKNDNASITMEVVFR